MLLIFAILFTFFVTYFLTKKIYRKKYKQEHTNTLNCFNLPSTVVSGDMHAYTIATQHRPALDLLIDSLNVRGVSVNVLGMNCKWQGFGKKWLWLKDYLSYQQLPKDDIVLLVDGYDTYNLASKAEFIEVYRSFKVPVIFGAEKGCHPNASLAELYPKVESPHCYLNAGVMIATVEACEKMLAFVNLKPNDDDQEFFTRLFLAHRDLITLDYDSKIFFNLFDVKENEYSVNRQDQRVTRLDTSTRPCFLHGNGPGKPVLDAMLTKLEIKTPSCVRGI